MITTRIASDSLVASNPVASLNAKFRRLLCWFISCRIYKLAKRTPGYDHFFVLIKNDRTAVLAVAYIYNIIIVHI